MTCPRPLFYAKPSRIGILTAPLGALGWDAQVQSCPCPHSPEHPIMYAVAGRQLTPFFDPAELSAQVAGHDTVELDAGPYALGLQLRCDLNGGRGSCWDGGGGERAGGACGDR